MVAGDTLSRLFFALWPDPELRGRLASLALNFPALQGRRVAEHSLHLTLCFIGSVDSDQRQRYQQVAEELKSASFELVLDRLGYFAGTRVLWLGAEQVPDELYVLVKNLNRLLRKQGYKSEKRSYKPHITLMRKARPLARLPDFEPITWRINGFVLVESLLQEVPVRYRVLKEYRLAS